MKNIKKEAIDIKNQIDRLPKGTLVYKTINGIKQPYLQQTINGKSKSTYIKKENREQILTELELRKELSKELNEKIQTLNESGFNFQLMYAKDVPFKTTVLFGDKLLETILPVIGLKERYCYGEIEKYLDSNKIGKVLILYGLRRTGKTTLMKQTIYNLGNDEFYKAAYIQIKPNNIIDDLYHDLQVLLDNGFKYVFIDEVTMMSDFIEGAAMISDIYASSGMKIILSGTDSLGFWFTEDDQLYDRAVFVHTTYISYAEFEDVLGITGIDKYIQYGGTMSIENENYNHIFKDNTSINEYVDSAIAHNIQHSLLYYDNERHFRHLDELYEHNELTNVINRVVEDVNHHFTIDVLTKDFISHDLGFSKRNFRKSNQYGDNILDNIDEEAFINNFKAALEILNKNEQFVSIKDIHCKEIEEYLSALDLIKYIDINTIPSDNEKRTMTVFTQVGMRYSQAKTLVETLMKDKIFDDISINVKSQIINRILNEIKGRLIEEIILLDSTIRNPDKSVFKLQFARGEFDMVIQDNENLSCEIYEIKYSNEIYPDQYKNLIDEEKCSKTEFKYGKITGKYVIYNGDNKILDNGIKYINVTNYLKNNR